ncbi:TatD DNase family protein [Apostasia shenzhenica]|uniref:TatD DNase family protein n=1 Tax=Apostasia shenzhenica TaxID=1088818 RepID=A0A2H9ZR65_9ASPA|nr:TatD DNase family protein [Apostasia shenzhenica]
MFKGIYNGKQCHAGDIPAVLARAWSAGVDRIIVTGGSLEGSREALAIAETDGRLFCTVGVHPTRCKEFEESGDPEKHFKDLLSLAKEGVAKGKVVAVGECGLDYDRLHFCSSEVQKKFTGGVVHSFTGSTEDCDQLLSFEKLFIGVNGCSLKTTENLSVVKGIPIERMMIETDSPYCEIKNTHAGIHFVKSTWPSKKKEKYDPDSTVKGRNEPCFVRQVLEVVAGCKGMTNMDQLSKTVYHNTCRIFFPQDLDTVADALLQSGGEVLKAEKAGKTGSSLFFRHSTNEDEDEDENENDRQRPAELGIPTATSCAFFKQTKGK